MAAVDRPAVVDRLVADKPAAAVLNIVDNFAAVDKVAVNILAVADKNSADY